MSNSLIYSKIVEKSLELGLEKISFSSSLNINNNFITIITAGISYNYNWNNVSDVTPGYIARYTTANFYKHLRHKLKELSDFIYQEFNETRPKKIFSHISINANFNDKLIALKSGLGPQLKNSLISVNNKGCKFVIGNLLINRKIEYTEAPYSFKTNCENCNLCVISCPTGALNKNGIIDKSICLHHLSSQIGHYFDSKLNIVLKNWNNRFFGCTKCVDVCPQNNKDTILTSNNDLPGFIGTTFSKYKLTDIKKSGFLKEYFTGNQLGASWIPESALIRNLIIKEFNNNNLDEINTFYNNIDFTDINLTDKTYLRNFLRLLKKM